MVEDFTPLLAAIRRVYPNARLEPLTESELSRLREQHPGVPGHYLSFLREVGWGSLGNNFMIYSGPISPEDIFDTETAKEFERVVLFGDDFSGEVIGFDTRQGWRIVSVGGHYSGVTSEDVGTVREYIARRLANAEG